jgi:AmiR/NasT family two-component response regulator
VAQVERETESDLTARGSRLEQAFESRVVIEQAKGMIAARHHVDVHTAFDVLRRAARSNHLNIRELAERVVSEPATPAEIVLQLYG